MRVCTDRPVEQQESQITEVSVKYGSFGDRQYGLNGYPPYSKISYQPLTPPPDQNLSYTREVPILYSVLILANCSVCNPYPWHRKYLLPLAPITLPPPPHPQGQKLTLDRHFLFRTQSFANLCSDNEKPSPFASALAPPFVWGTSWWPAPTPPPGCSPVSPWPWSAYSMTWLRRLYSCCRVLMASCRARAVSSNSCKF